MTLVATNCCCSNVTLYNRASWDTQPMPNNVEWLQGLGVRSQKWKYIEQKDVDGVRRIMGCMAEWQWWKLPYVIMHSDPCYRQMSHLAISPMNSVLYYHEKIA